MTRKIAILPPGLASQIAAGEVIERPASVVKELVENALDAASREVRVETEEGGRRLIRVSDDGEGMGPEDALAAFERHATSKIHSAADLHAVASYGFRGEALPSIASVARVRLITRRDGDPAALEIRIAAGAHESRKETGAPRGTLVEVTDLFFNTPARRKFLRRAGVEASYVTEIVSRLALARPDVGFTLLRGERTVLDARAGVPLTERIIEVLGGAAGRDLLPLDFQAGAITVQGFISPPDKTHPTARSVYIFVNDRPVRDRALQHALVSASRDFIPADRFPLAVLQLRVSPDAVDENVHPTKLEVRFMEGRAVYDAVRRATLEALRSWSPLGRTGTGPGQVVQESLARYLAGARTEAPLFGRSGGGLPMATMAAAGIPLPVPDTKAPAAESPTAARYLGQAHETYLLFESGEGILILDQHAAHERLVFEQIRKQIDEGGIAVQPLLVPRTLEMSPARLSALDARREEITKLGFELEPFGGNTIAIKAVPALLGKADLGSLIASVADDLAEEGGPEALEQAFRSALATIACHGSVRAGQRLDRQQAEALLARLEDTGGAGTCPHGRPVAIRLPRSDLERLFRRT